MEEVTRATVKVPLRLGALEAPVALYKATGKPAAAPEFEKAGPSGGALAREAVVGASKADAFLAESSRNTVAAPAARPFVEAGTGEKVDAADARIGVRKPDGTFVDLTVPLEELDKDVELDRIEVIGFQARNSVPRERISGAYYLGVETGTAAESADALRLIRDALRRTERVALVRWTKRKGQALGVLSAHSSGSLLINELVWSDEARAPNAECLVIDHVDPPTEEQLALAEDLIKEMSVKPSEAIYANPRLKAQQELAARAAAGELDEWELADLEEPEPEEMRELADLLEDTLKGA